MPNTKSAIKAAKQTLRRRVVNLAVLEKVRKATKQVRKLKTAEALKQAFSALDKAAKKHVIHKNKASRLKARLTKLVTKKTA